MLGAGLAEAGILHPALAVGAGEVEAAGGLDEHVEAHHKAEGVLRAVIVDDRFEDDEGAAGRDGFVGFADEHALDVKVPVVEDVAHDDDVGRGQRVIKEAAGDELEARGEAQGCSIILEDGSDLREVEAGAGEVRVGEGDLGGGVTLSGANVDEGAVLSPGEFGGDGASSGAADTAKAGDDLAETGWVHCGVEGGEIAVGEPTLRLTASEAFGELAPVGIEAVVGHFEEAADVAGLAAVEEEVGGRCVGVGGIGALEETERDEGVEKVAGGARVEAQAAAEGFEFFGAVGELGEEPHLDGAEQDFGGPEAEAYLEDVLGRGGGIVCHKFQSPIDLELRLTAATAHWHSLCSGLGDGGPATQGTALKYS